MKKWLCLLLAGVLLLALCSCKEEADTKADFVEGSLLFDIGAESIDSVENFTALHEVNGTEIMFTKEEIQLLTKYRFQENCSSDLMSEVFLFPKTKRMQIYVNGQSFPTYLLEDGRIVVRMSDGYKVYTADEEHVITSAIYQALIEKYFVNTQSTDG